MSDTTHHVVATGAQRSAAAVQRLEASRTRWRAALTRPEPVGGLGGLAGLTAHLAAVVQRHPGLCAAGAVLLGAVLARAKPWRWALSSGLWAMLLPRLLPTVMSTLASVKLGLWSEIIMAWLNAAGPEAAPATRAPSPDPTRGPAPEAAASAPREP